MKHFYPDGCSLFQENSEVAHSNEDENDENELLKKFQSSLKTSVSSRESLWVLEIGVLS